MLVALWVHFYMNVYIFVSPYTSLFARVAQPFTLKICHEEHSNFLACLFHRFAVYSIGSLYCSVWINRVSKIRFENPSSLDCHVSDFRFATVSLIDIHVYIMYVVRWVSCTRGPTWDTHARYMFLSETRSMDIWWNQKQCGSAATCTYARMMFKIETVN